MQGRPMPDDSHARKQRFAIIAAAGFAVIMALALEPASALLTHAVDGAAARLAPTYTAWAAGALWLASAVLFGGVAIWLFARTLNANDKSPAHDGLMRIVWRGRKFALAFLTIAALFLTVEALLGFVMIIIGGFGWSGTTAGRQAELLVVALVPMIMAAWWLGGTADDAFDALKSRITQASKEKIIPIKDA
jgi:hypothetical protein